MLVVENESEDYIEHVSISDQEFSKEEVQELIKLSGFDRKVTFQ